MLKRFVLTLLIVGVVVLNTACMGGSVAGAGGSGGTADAETEEEAAEPSVLDGVDVNALLSKKLGDVIDALGSEHSEPYVFGYDTCIDYGDDCTIWYRTAIEKGGPAVLDPQAYITWIEIFCEKDVYKGIISVGKSIDAINAGLRLQGEDDFSEDYEDETQDGLSGASKIYSYNGNPILIWVNCDENGICRSIFISPEIGGAAAVKRDFGVDAAGDNDEYFVLNGVNDVSALLSKPLNEVIGLLGQDHSEPYFREGGTSIVYMGSCRLSYLGAIEKDKEPQIEPDAEVGIIEIFQEKDVYKGISVGKTLDEINSNPDLLNKIELGTDYKEEYVENDYGLFSGMGVYAYGDSLIRINMDFDDQLVCVSIFIKEYDTPDVPVDAEIML